MREICPPFRADVKQRGTERKVAMWENMNILVCIDKQCTMLSKQHIFLLVVTKVLIW